MGSLVYTLFSMVQVASLHCSQRPEISPCSCKPHDFFNNTIHVSCAGLASFNQVFDSLQNKFSLKDHIWLEIKKSQLDDLETRNFKDMNMNITKLYLNYDELRYLGSPAICHFLINILSVNMCKRSCFFYFWAMETTLTVWYESILCC